MDASLAKRIERALDRIAAASLGLAAGYAACRFLGASSAHPQIYAEGAGVGAIAYAYAGYILSRIGKRRSLPVPVFDVRTIDPLPQPELLLTEVAGGSEKTDNEPFVLDDILAKLEADARVVQLFDRAAMPTPKQLKSKVDAHLGGERPKPAAPDATQALHDALAELRRAIG